MAKIVDPSRVLDEAQFVKTSEVHPELALVQVWYGGVQVRVFTIDLHNEFREVDIWTMSNQLGQPVEQEEIEEAMQRHFEITKHELEGDR